MALQPNSLRVCSAKTPAGSIGWFAVAVSITLGCDPPKVEFVEDCKTVCGPDVGCPDDMTCEEGFCVSVDRLGSCRKAANSAGAAGRSSSKGEIGGRASSRGGEAAGDESIFIPVASATSIDEGGAAGGSDRSSPGGNAGDAATGGISAYGGAVMGGTGGIATGGKGGSGTEGRGGSTVPEGGGNGEGPVAQGGESNIGGVPGSPNGTSGSGGNGFGSASINTQATIAGMGGGGIAGTASSASMPPLAIDSSPTWRSTHCTAKPVTYTLTAAGGGPSFTWSVASELGCSVMDPPEQPNVAVLACAPQEARGTFAAVTLTDQTSGTKAILSTQIAASPAITTAALTEACIGEKYKQQLQATGQTNLTWSATLDPAFGLSLASNGELSGVLLKSGTLTLSVTATDTTTGCQSQSQQIVLTVWGEERTACPKIALKNLPTSAPAPESCQYHEYRAEFDVRDGSPPYVWAQVTAPSGIQFDPTTQIASGTSVTSAGDLTLQVIDSTKRVIQKTFPIPMREKCWFGYIAPMDDNSDGPDRMHLFDAMLGKRLERPTSTSPDLWAVDFKFSPDGKFVAYRVQDASGNYQLVLWQKPHWTRESPLSFSGSVEHYAWSNNSSILAVGVRNGSALYLDGVDVSAVVDDTATTGTIQGIMPLDEVSAPVESDITWYGNDGYVAFHSFYAPDAARRITTAMLQSRGFASVTTRNSEYDLDLHLLPAPTGYFSVDVNMESVVFHPIDSTQTVPHENVTIAPNGTLVGLLLGNQLGVFLPTSSTMVHPDLPWGRADGCEAILGWAERQQRIVCMDQTASSVKMHTWTPPDSSVASFAVASSSQYAKDNWTNSRRLISPTGHWMAASTADRLYVADLSLMAPAVVYSWTGQQSEPIVDFAFSPDDTLLATQRGKEIRVINLETLGNPLPLTSAGIAPPSCQESRPASPEWCGRASDTTHWAWSPDSKLLSYALETEKLVIYLHSLVGSVEATTSCGATCARSALFQP